MATSRVLAGLFGLGIVLTAPVPAGSGSRAARVEKGLAPPVLIEGDATWTLEERMRHYHVPGVSIAVIENFEIAWAKGYGVKDTTTREPVDEHTLFQAGSISKPVAATVVLKKVEEGKLDLAADVNSQLASWRLPDNELTAKKKVTLANLLSHTGGLTVHGFPGYEAGAALPTLPQVLDGAPPANTAPVRVDLEPGTQFRYSGGGTTIAQLIVQDLEGQPFDVVAQKTVLDPVGMRDSTYAQPLPEALRTRAASGYRLDGSAVPGRFHTYPEQAAAGLWTTATDLAKFGIEMQRSLAGKSNKVLSQKTVERMLTPYLAAGPTGLGFFIEDHGGAIYFGHNGADEGFTAMLLVHKTKGYGAAVMINSDSFNLMPEILRGVAREYGWDGYMPPPFKPAAVAPETLDRFAGRYKVDDDTVFAVRRDPDGLSAQRGVGPAFALIPISGTTFVQREATTRYAFETNAAGEVAALAIEGPGTVRAPRLSTADLVPFELLAAGRTAEAIEAYRTLRREHPDSPHVAERRLNSLGYELLGADKLAAAIAVFRLNVELYPGSWNAYDSLGEAYAAGGETQAAIESYEKSIELNPENRNGMRVLETLKAGGGRP